jgi:predicted lipoprotein with Yx(FWY)xxD motif
MNKRTTPIIVIIIVIILAVGAYAVFHKSNTTSSNSSTTPPASSSTSTSGASAVTTKTDSKGVQYLAAANGKPLYTYGADTSGVSNCTGTCLSEWPAYTVASSAANLPANVSTITRSDNHQMQYTYNGKPLYFFVSDSSGDPTGDGVSNFSLAKPAASSSAQPTSPTPTPSSNNSSPY